MELHENKSAFRAIVNRISKRTGIAPSIIEKDYYVSLVLRELAQKQDSVSAFFKGGTCLYKVYMDMKRFSEDIDLTVRIDSLSNSQAKKMLERASNGYTCMERLKGDPLEENRKASITSVYGYEPMFEVDLNDRLQRYGKVKVEATSFTISEPTETNSISSLIYQYANDGEKEILKEQFGVEAFQVRNISIERIFADKLLAAEFYLERGQLFDVAKHLYDLSEMLEMSRIQRLVKDDDSLIKALSYKREEEKIRIGSDLSNKPLSDLELFKAKNVFNSNLEASFSDMQRIYVIHDADRQDINSVRDKLEQLRDICLSISSKEHAVNCRSKDLTSTVSRMEDAWYAYFQRPLRERRGVEWEGQLMRIAVFEDKYIAVCREAGADPDKKISDHFWKNCVAINGYEPKFFSREDSTR